MSVYLFPNNQSSHYESFLDSIPEINGHTDKEKIESIDNYLSPFKGKIIPVNGWRGSLGIIGIEFETEEDLMFF